MRNVTNGDQRKRGENKREEKLFRLEIYVTTKINWTSETNDQRQLKIEEEKNTTNRRKYTEKIKKKKHFGVTAEKNSITEIG